MDINELLGIGIVGAALSFVIEGIQMKFGIGSGKTKALSIVLSVVVGGGYYLVRETSWWLPMVGVLASASTVYALFFSGNKSD